MICAARVPAEGLGAVNWKRTIVYIGHLQARSTPHSCLMEKLCSEIDTAEKGIELLIVTHGGDSHGCYSFPLNDIKLVCIERRCVKYTVKVNHFGGGHNFEDSAFNAKHLQLNNVICDLKSLTMISLRFFMLIAC